MTYLGLPSAHTLPAIGLALIEALPKLTPSRSRRLVELGRALKKEMHDVLGDNGVLVCPTFPTTSPKHNIALFPPTNFVHTAIWNILETPVTGRYLFCFMFFINILVIIYLFL